MELLPLPAWLAVTGCKERKRDITWLILAQGYLLKVVSGLSPWQRLAANRQR